ncbi:MAG TPA: flagellar biosynthesis anti-sigma factor FlgM [Bryobacteraceae bacterium]|jgi:flagellar biosynthesis anti-sigma factor FlgM
MKVNDPNLSSLGATETSRTQTSRNSSAGRNTASGSGVESGDDIHLSELVRSLRALAADSPDRQARIEQIARNYTNGAYKVDAQGTASKIIDDASQK